MSIQSINIGSVADDGTGDPLRTAFGKTNDNFIELESNVSSLNSSVVSLNASVNTVNSNLISTVTSVNTVNANLVSNVSTLNSAINLVNANLISNVSSLTASINLVNANAVVLASNVSSLTANISNILSGTTSFAGNKTFTGNVGIGTSPSAKLDIAETWNNVSTTFTAIRANVTDTSSTAGSLLLDLQVGGASKFRVGKDGQVSAGSFMMGSSPESTTSMSGLLRNGNNLLVNTVGTQAFNFSTASFISTRPIAFGTSAYAADVVLNRDAADTLAQRNGTSAQTSRIYGTYTDASNYERGYLTANTDGLTIGHEALGTGSGRAISLKTGSGRYLVLSSATTLDTNAVYTRFYSSTTVVANFNTNTKQFVIGLGGAYAFSAGADSFDTTVDLVIARDAPNTLAQRNGVNPQTSRIYNTYTDASNYERGVIGWTANALQIGTEALGTGTRRPINLNYTTSIDGFARTNVPVLTLSNVGAGNAGLLVGQLQVGYQQDHSRLNAFYTTNKGLGYNHGGTGVANQGAHRFSTDSTFGSWVGTSGSVVDIIAPATLTNIFQCRQANDAIVLNVAYSGAITIANTLTQSTEATTLATVTKTQIASFPVASFRSGKLLVQAYDTVTGATQISEILLAHNVNSASHTEYGIVFTGATSIVAYDVDIASANVRLMATRTTTNSTQYKISETLIAS